MPNTIPEAYAGPHGKEWRASVKREFDSITNLGVYVLSLLPKGMRALDCKTVFKIKYNRDYTIDKFKTRICVRGFRQKQGEEYHETFAPTVQLASVRVLLSLIVQHRLKPFQWDVGTAFLYSELEGDVDIYVRAPEGLRQYDQHGAELYWHLRKAIYGLKQAPRAWNQTMTRWLKSYGFEQSVSDSGLFVYNKHGIICILSLYVDDIPGGCNCDKFLTQLYSDLSKDFAMTKKDKLDFLLGIEIDIDADGDMILHQSKYIHDCIERFGLKGHPAVIPMDPNFQISIKGTAKDDKLSPDQKRDLSKKYKSMIGALLWISRSTRPDIAFAVSVLCRYTHDPKLRHMQAIEQVFYYLLGTASLGLFYTKSEADPQLTAFCDADYANDMDNRKSTSGLMVFFWVII